MTTGPLVVPDDDIPSDAVRCDCGWTYDPATYHDCVSAWRDAFTDAWLTLERERLSAADLRWALRMCEGEVLRLRGDLARALAVLT